MINVAYNPELFSKIVTQNVLNKTKTAYLIYCL